MIDYRTKVARRLNVDHDHVTGKVRGLLCSACNMAIGHLRDDPDLALAMAQYLRKARAAGLPVVEARI